MGEALAIDKDDAQAGDTQAEVFNEFREKDLIPFGWTYKTPVDGLLARSRDRMGQFFVPINDIETLEQSVKAAFYALELSSANSPVPLRTPKKAATQFNRLGKLRREGLSSEDEYRIVDDFIIATGVDRDLRLAYDVYSRSTEAHIKLLLEATAEYSAANVGSLMAIEEMQVYNAELGGVLMRSTAKTSDFLLRFVLAREKDVTPSSLERMLRI